MSIARAASNGCRWRGKTSPMRPFRSLGLVALLAVASFVVAQDQPAKRTLKPDDFAKWERLGPVQISPDGHWIASNIFRVEGDPRLEIRNSDGPQRDTLENATRAQFTDDSKWLLFTVSVPRKEAEQMIKQKKRPENSLGARSLVSGDSVNFDSVQSWQIVKGSTKVLIQRYPAEGQEKAGSDFEIFDLADGSTMPIGNVKDYLAHPDGGYVALHTVSAAGNEAVQVVTLSHMGVTTVAWSKDHYSDLAWSKDGDTLAFLDGTKKEGKEGDWNKVVMARGFSTGEFQQATFDPATEKGFPEGDRISNAAGLDVSKDGSSIVFDISQWHDQEKPDPNAEIPGVEIWNTKDVTVMPLQVKTAQQERNRATSCYWQPDGDVFVPFAEKELDNVQVSPDHMWAVAFDPRPYANPVKKNGLEYVDVLAINVRDGSRRTMLKKAVSNAGGIDAMSLSLSPEGRYALTFDGADWVMDELATGKKTNLTMGLGVKFFDREDDHTVPKPPAGGTPVWLKDDAGVVLHGDYDAFLVDPATGKATRLTKGDDNEVRYRLLDAGYHDDGIHAGDPLYFSVFESKTKRSGFSRWTEKDGLQPLVMDDAQLSWAARSKDTDRVLFVYQTYEISPTALLTNLDFAASKAVVRTNTDQKDFLWGHDELVHYKALGKDLEGVLIYPADYQPGKQYPMVTYIYEKLSDWLHRYQTPSNTSPYNAQYFSQSGYFVFMPDIVYRDRQPGVSAVTCIEAGVRAVLAKNVGVDGKHIGLTGHSWGAYQTVFTSTKSKMFAAYVAGAPLTELISMYSSFYWNWGQTNQVIFEVSQGRMGVPFWEDMKAYIDNSPLFHAGDITSPMLVEVGTVDGAVDWHQGQYLYNTLRRMGKNMVMLVYANENHGLAIPANQKDAMRARHFFDVYLKGATPEKWLDKGVPYIELGQELKKEQKKDDSGGKTPPPLP